MFSNAALLSLSKKLTFFITSIVVFVFLYGVLPAASAPTVAGIEFQNDDPYETGDEVEVWVRFTDNVTVTGTPRLGFNIGGTTKYAYYRELDHRVLRFFYTVQVDDYDRDGLSIINNSLELNGGSITAVVDGEDAVLDHNFRGYLDGEELYQAVNFYPFTDEIIITNSADFGEDTEFQDEMVGIRYTYEGARPTVSLTFAPAWVEEHYPMEHLTGDPNVIIILQKPRAPAATVTVTLTGTEDWPREIRREVTINFSTSSQGTAVYPTVTLTVVEPDEPGLTDIVHFTLTEPDTEFRGQGEITLAVDPSSAAADYTLYVGGSSLEDGIWTANGSITQADPNEKGRTIPGATVTLSVQSPTSGNLIEGLTFKTDTYTYTFFQREYTFHQPDFPNPGLVRSLRQDPDDGDNIVIRWGPPLNTGSGLITHYEVSYKKGTENFGDWFSTGLSSQLNLPGIEDDTNVEYEVKVRAVNSEGLAGDPVSLTGLTLLAGRIVAFTEEVQQPPQGASRQQVLPQQEESSEKEEPPPPVNPDDTQQPTTPPDDTQQPTTPPDDTQQPTTPPATNNPGSGGGGGGGGTPRRDTVTATKVPYSPIVINEIGNNEGNAHDWVELLNVTDTEVDLEKWELTQIVSENSETALVAFPDGKGAHTIPAQGVLLLVGSDPFQDTEHPLAAGIKINADTSSARREKKTGIRSRYYVDARLQLSDTEPSLLVLRNAKNKKRTSENIVDLTGSLYIEDASTDFQTQLWPLQATQAGSDDVLRELDEAFVAGKVYQRRKIKAGTAEHTWGSRWYTGVGYKRTAKQVAANGGTPGFPNDAIKAQISDLVENATVSISEIMYTPGRGMPQWIELYNSATTQAVNLKDWELQLESAAGADVRNITLTLKANILIQPNQPLLLVSAKTESDQHSGHFPPSRLINLWGLYRSELAVIDAGRQYTLLSPNAFRLTLREKGGGVVDVAGNLDDAGQARWALPTAEAGRSSILRVYDKATGPRDGTLGVAGTAKTYGWILAADRAALAPQPLYYGHRDDQGSPGYRIGGALPVSLSLFRSRRVESGVVVVKWVTESELNNAGFNILRSETREGAFERVNASLIAGQGTTSERTVYTWTDSTAKPEVFYYYQIEEVSLAGERLPLATARLRGHISAAGKLTTRWGALKQPLH